MKGLDTDFRFFHNGKKYFVIGLTIQESLILTPQLEAELRKAASKNGLYVPGGALWGGEDIRYMHRPNNYKETPNPNVVFTSV